MIFTKLRVAASAIGTVTLAAASLRAEVFQTGDGTLLPQPVLPNEVTLSRDLGWAADRQIYKDFDGTDIYPPKLYTDLESAFGALLAALLWLGRRRGRAAR